MEARLVTCAAPGAYRAAGLFETCIAALRNALQPEKFVF
jgi:protein-L-isoaspartate(D-aspartate) O-methyltransferase